jgi:hypothetical protein
MTDTHNVRRVDSSARKLEAPAMPPHYDNLEAHPLAEEYPMADDHELAGLRRSIESNGIYSNNKITLYEGKILDGRNRYKAAKEVGHKFTAADFFEFIGTVEKAEEYVYTSNSARRNLTEEQKKAQVRKLVDKHPKWSTRKLAELCGVSHMTVARIRKPKEVEKEDTYKPLVKAWENATFEDQERFVRENKPDLTEMLAD